MTYHATVYSRPGCQKCKYTERKLDKIGVAVDTVMIDDHPDKITLMQKHGWSALPLVELTAPNGEVMRWHDLSTADLDATKALVQA